MLSSDVAVVLVDRVFYEVVVRMYVDDLHDSLKRVLAQGIIAVDKGDILAMRFMQSVITCLTESFIFCRVSICTR